MSIELIQLYQKLSPLTRSQLAEAHQKSPKMCLLLGLLETQNLHSTNKAVSHIYATEINEGVKREVLTNRFYKLREKAKEVLTDCFKNTSAGLAAPQKELNFICFLVSEKQFSQAANRLKELEKICWEQNLFECLPAVYELLIDTVYGVEPFQKDLLKTYYEQKKNAVYLRQQLEHFLNHIHDFYLQPADYNDLLKQLRERLKPLKQYPRFELIYHYFAIRAGAFVEVVNNKPQSASARHFNSFRAIVQQHPQMPILRLEENEQKGILAKMLNVEVMFWYARADKPKIKQPLEQLLAIPNLLSYCTERDLFNLCLITIQSKFFAMARRFLDLLAQFQEAQYEHESDIPWQYFELLWYCKQHPNVQPPNLAQYVQKIAQQIETRNVSKKPNPGIWVYGVLIVYTTLCGDLATAEMLLKMPICLEYEQKMVVPADVATFFGLVKTANFADLLEFQTKMLAQSKDKNLKISHRKHYELLGEAAQGVLNLKKYS